MKRVIALIISIAMIASLAAGLTVTGMALDSAILRIKYGDETYENTGGCVDAYSDPLPEGLSVSYDSETNICTVTVSDPSVSVKSIYSEAANLVIDLNGKTLTVSNPNPGNAIYVNDENLTINGPGKLIATAETFSARAINVEGNLIITGVDVVAHGNQYGIYAGKDIIITGGTVEATGEKSGFGGSGIYASNTLNISSNNVKAKAKTAFGSGNDIAVNGVSITDITLTNQYFSCDNGGELVYSSITNNIAINSSPTDKWVYVKQNGNSDPVEEESTEENDPEVEIDFGFGPVTVKTSNKSLVLNDKKIVETEVLQSENLFVPFDLSNTPVKLDGLFLNNDVYQYISGVGKGIELETRFAKADVFKKDNIGQNPLSLHLSDVSEVAGTCATAIQKKAMNTNKVYAEVNYSFVTNGNPTDNNARIYVPVDGPAKVFYLFNAEKIGIVPCEVKDGYCEFNRYFDGSYVVCAK